MTLVNNIWSSILIKVSTCKYLRLPFGISSAPALFQKVMKRVLEGLTGVFLFLDDIVTTGDNDEGHIRNLTMVLQRLKQYGFRAKREKCVLMQPSVEYLGHIINSNGVKASDSKVKAVQGMPAPKNKSELRSLPRAHAQQGVK